MQFMWYFIHLSSVLYSILNSSLALNSGDEGVCDVVISSRVTKSKLVPVLVSKWCGKKKCTVKKTKRKTIVQTISKKHTVCCKGYQYENENDVCLPSCSTGCSAGKCIAPDVCHCEPPSVLDAEHKNACINPVCEPPCINAQCVMNDTCKCNEGFVAYNATYCISNCANGFIFDDYFECVPKCERNCVNSDCVAPNICRCHDGYKSSKENYYICEPVCECTNGYCLSPNVCTCLEGYVKASEKTCVPKCDSCQNGLCIAPDNCSCLEGYTKTEGFCTPICDEPCVNGVCSSPNVCSCIEGYIRNASYPHICFKACQNCTGFCTDRDGCINFEACHLPDLDKREWPS